MADRAADRVAQLIYLDAFVPRDGQAIFDLAPPGGPERMRALAKAEGDGWRVPPNPLPPDTPEADVAWLTARRMPQSLRTFEQGVRLTHGETGLPRTYVCCARIGPGDAFRQFGEWAQNEDGWRYRKLDASHSPHVTDPDGLTRLLDELASSRA